jgi:fructokinase
MTGPKVLVVGDTLVDFVPDRSGPPTEETSFTSKFGGAGANVAMVLARLGSAPFYWTNIARDDFGDFLAERIDESEVRTEFVQRDADAKTTLAFVTHDEAGDPTFNFFRERTADARLKRGQVDDETLEDLSWVHVTSTILSREPSRSVVLELVKRAQRHGCTVSLDPNARPELWDSGEAFEVVTRGALDNVDVIKAGPDDLVQAGFDVDRPPEAIARAVAERGPHTVFLTLGSDGSLCYGTAESPFEGVTSHPGYDVDPVDTTGAGDGFLAAAIVSMMHGVDDADALLSAANAAGAVVTTRQGALTALSDPATIREYCGRLPWE